jgi:hypothetical protein
VQGIGLQQDEMVPRFFRIVLFLMGTAFFFGGAA